MIRKSEFVAKLNSISLIFLRKVVESKYNDKIEKKNVVNSKPFLKNKIFRSPNLCVVNFGITHIHLYLVQTDKFEFSSRTLQDTINLGIKHH